MASSSSSSTFTAASSKPELAGLAKFLAENINKINDGVFDSFKVMVNTIVKANLKLPTSNSTQVILQSMMFQYSAALFKLLTTCHDEMIIKESDIKIIPMYSACTTQTATTSSKNDEPIKNNATTSPTSSPSP